MTEKIPVLYSLRFICCLMVFLFHAGISETGGYFVTIFIVLSGFFSIYAMREYEGEKKYLIDVKYLIHKIKKFYPLHIITFALAVPIAIEKYCGFGIIKRILITLCYNTYVQAFIPDSDYYFAYNGVEWTMSVLFFCWMLTPIMYKFIKSINVSSFRTLLIVFVCIYLLEIAYIMYFKNNYNYIWWCSVNPLFRSLDYFTGCCVGYFYKHFKYDKRKPYGIMQGLSMLLLIFVCTMLIPNLNPSFCWSLIMLPVSVAIILSFAVSRDSVVTKIFENRIFVYLGYLSYEIYMLHNLILNYMRYIKVELNEYLSAVLAFGLTLIMSVIIRFLYRKLLINKRKESVSNI